MCAIASGTASGLLTQLSCRSCGARALRPVIDLGEQPLSGSFPLDADAAEGEPRWPLRAVVCAACWWMQLADDTPDEPDVGGPPMAAISSTIRRHAEELIDWLGDVLAIGPGARVLEVASHGNILAGLLRTAGWQVTTIESRPSAVAAARAAGFDVVEGQISPAIATRLAGSRGVDLFLDTFLLSHLRAPRIELAAVAAAIGAEGVAVIELDHVLPLLEDARFDAIRHGHFSYASLSALLPAARAEGLDVVAADRLAIYGGAMRVTLAPLGARPVHHSVVRLLDDERRAGVTALPLYGTFAGRVASTIADLRAYLAAARAAGRHVAAYGAPSRGNTLLNAAGIGPDEIAYTADASPAKQGRVLPGSRIPIVSPETLMERRPDVIVVLTWDIADEVIEQLGAAREWGCQFVVPMPKVRVIRLD